MEKRYQMNLNIICDLKWLKLQILRRFEASSSPLEKRNQNPNLFFLWFGFWRPWSKRKSIQFEHKPNVNVDWTGESIWPSLHLPEKEEMQSYFIRKGKRKTTMTQYQEAKVSNMLLALLMLCVVLNNPWWQVNSFKSEELSSPDLGKHANILH